MTTTTKTPTPEQHVRAIARTCRGPRSVAGDAAVAAALTHGDQALAAKIDDLARAGCGQDVNDLILAAPLDGQPHEAVCPRCGVRLTWTAPVFESTPSA